MRCASTYRSICEILSVTRRCTSLFCHIRSPYPAINSASHSFATRLLPCTVTARSFLFLIHCRTVEPVYPVSLCTSAGVNASGSFAHIRRKADFPIRGSGSFR